MSDTADSEGIQNARVPRSRLDRPCDLCRRLKQLCILEIRGQPCVACRTRRKSCTFDLPPTSRKRKRKDAPSESTTDIPANEEIPQASSSSNMITGTLDTSLPVELPSLNTDNQPLQPSTWSDNDACSSQHILQYSNLQQVESSGVRAIDNLTFEPTDHELLFNNSILWVDGTENRPIVHPPSLDMEDSNEEESHFVGADSFSSLVVEASDPSMPPRSEGDLSFRQVSSDHRYPVYFVKAPALMYGRTPHDGKTAFAANCRLCSDLGPDYLTKAIDAVQRYLLAPIPIINAKRLESSCLGLDSNIPVPHALLAGILSHSTHYISELRPMHRQLWSNTLLALDDDFRQPRLATLQLALLQMYSRPMEIAENAGQLTIGSGRAIGAALLLGLHMDPSNWSLPLWERSLRKRIWWALLIQDKWRALLYGRPSFLHRSSYNVAMLTIEDGDWGKYAPSPDRISLESFIATCQLTEIIDNILDTLHAGAPNMSNSSSVNRIAQLEDALEKIFEINKSYSHSFGSLFQTSEEQAVLPTGVRSFQLSSLGLIVLVRRLLLRSIEDTEKTRVQSLIVLVDAHHSCQDMTKFIDSLTIEDEQMYWTPYAFYHIANTISLLLYIVKRSRSIHPDLAEQAVSTTVEFISSLIRRYQRTKWDIVAVALRRAVVLLMWIKQDLPQFNQSYLEVATALNLPTFATNVSVDDFLSSLGIDVPEAWSQMVDDQSWLASVGFQDTQPSQ